MKEAFWAIIAASVIATFPLGASADSITSPDGEYQVGITQYGNLYDPISGIGFKRVSDGVDVLGSGSHREAYGFDLSSSSILFGYVDPAQSGINHAVVEQTSFQTSGAFVRTLLYDRIQLDQKFAFAANNVLAIHSTVTHVGPGGMFVTYSRIVDFNVAPTQGQEIVQVDPYPAGFVGPIISATAELLRTPASSFWYPSPTSGETRTGDLGGAFDLAIRGAIPDPIDPNEPFVGALMSGESVSFTVYYGLNRPGQSVTDLRKQVSDLGATFQISATSSNTTGDVNSAVLAYGPAIPSVNPVPAPPGVILGVFGFGIVGLSRWVRRSAGNAAVSA